MLETYNCKHLYTFLVIFDPFHINFQTLPFGDKIQTKSTHFEANGSKLPPLYSIINRVHDRFIWEMCNKEKDQAQKDTSRTARTTTKNNTVGWLIHKSNKRYLKTNLINRYKTFTKSPPRNPSNRTLFQLSKYKWMEKPARAVRHTDVIAMTST
ncbi:hypothetical protein HanPSC8_Chr01g0033021 [Helianthus annuus]|nr:hypothetical protein HanPSC8_Chr01g0033021 [Helianthus annuus]